MSIERFFAATSICRPGENGIQGDVCQAAYEICILKPSDAVVTDVYLPLSRQRIYFRTNELGVPLYDPADAVRASIAVVAARCVASGNFVAFQYVGYGPSLGSDVLISSDALKQSRFTEVHIEDIVVAPDHQGKGVATKVRNATLDFASKLPGCRTIYSTVPQGERYEAAVKRGWCTLRAIVDPTTGVASVIIFRFPT